MIDFKKWIYSKDMAEWLSKNVSFDIDLQMNCICSAPHRTLKEKVDGLEALYAETGERRVWEKMDTMKNLWIRSCQAQMMWRYFFQIEIFYQEQKQWHTSMIFRTAKRAADEIKQYIEQISAEDGLKKEYYHGIIHVYYRWNSPYIFIHEEDFVTRFDGEVLFTQYPYPGQDNEGDGIIAKLSERFPYYEIPWKLPYSSGTIVEVENTPFFPSIKGVLVNSMEPDEEGFADDRHNQWLIFSEQLYREQTHGINLSSLADSYVPFPCSEDLMGLPYQQYISIFEGELKENEAWIAELSKLIRSNKNCFDTILHDREPKSVSPMEQDGKRLSYIRELVERVV